MALLYSEPLWFQNPSRPGDTERLRALLREDSEACSLLLERLASLQEACSQGARDQAQPPWAMAIFTLADRFSVLLQTSYQPAGFWENALRAADISPYRQRGLELGFEAALHHHNLFAKWACVDELFLKTFRSAAFLVCLSSQSKLICRTSEAHRPLAEAALADLYCHALPPQHRRFISAVAGSGCLPMEDYGIVISAGGTLPLPEESESFTGALVDFKAEPPRMQLYFPCLNFAQRTARSLLRRLDLPFLVSMWNAAERLVAEVLGAEAAMEAQDLITWQMLRKNFASHKFSITEKEHERLQRRVKLFHEMTETRLS
ncbi:MAG: hypothetical protein FWH26_00540 [Oscillospiraceae bacterium]|nr:hypothetical protein [Oscillospiraceae bacterium]